MWKTLALGLSFAVLATAVAAQPPCGERKQLIHQLAKKYQELSVAFGVANGGKLLEVLTQNDGKTWSIILTEPGGRSCLIAAGESWRETDPQPAGPGA